MDGTDAVRTREQSVFEPGGELEPQGSLVDSIAALGGRARLCEQFDPEGSHLYDDCFGVDPNEIDALRSALGKVPGPVLELAAGNGRLTVPLLQMGREVTAQDLSDGMLDRLKDRVAPLRPQMRARLHIVQGDMTAIRIPPELPQRYGVVALLLASISLVDRDQRIETLRSAKEHLDPGGVILFSVVVLRTPKSAGSDFTHIETGRSGQAYRIHETRQAGSSVRQVAIIPLLDDQSATVPVSIGVHNVLDLDEVLDEVKEAGLSIRDQHAAESHDQGLAEVFLEVG